MRLGRLSRLMNLVWINGKLQKCILKWRISRTLFVIQRIRGKLKKRNVIRVSSRSPRGARSARPASVEKTRRRTSLDIVFKVLIFWN